MRICLFRSRPNVFQVPVKIVMRKSQVCMNLANSLHNTESMSPGVQDIQIQNIGPKVQTSLRLHVEFKPKLSRWNRRVAMEMSQWKNSQWKSRKSLGSSLPLGERNHGKSAGATKVETFPTFTEHETRVLEPGFLQGKGNIQTRPC